MKIILIREQDNLEKFTRGKLQMPSGQLFHTLELPWNDNKDNVSCIPYGVYTCKKINSPKFGNTFEISGVPNRDHILFHSGNYEQDTHGCVLLGLRKGASCILASKAAMEMFLEELKDCQEFDLEIR